MKNKTKSIMKYSIINNALYNRLKIYCSRCKLKDLRHIVKSYAVDCPTITQDDFSRATRKSCMNTIQLYYNTIAPIENEEKKRISCEHNCCEFITALGILYPTMNIETMKSRMERGETFDNIVCAQSDIIAYGKDVIGKELLCETYLKVLRSQLTTFSFDTTDIDKIIVTGKTVDNEDIKSLNAAVYEISKKDAKADIYILLNDGTYCGLSIKQSKHATKSNYSVQKYFSRDESAECNSIKKQYLIDSGFPVFKKDERGAVNALFYRENPYFDKLRELIAKHNQDIKKSLMDSLYGANIDYNLYEFDGEKLTLLKKDYTIESVTFDEHIPFYYKNNGTRRNAAKMFYKLLVEDGHEYRVEIRWKGIVHTASPQFQIHEL